MCAYSGSKVLLNDDIDSFNAKLVKTFSKHGASPVFISTDYEVLGCFTDNDIRFNLIEDDNMTQEMCASHCYSSVSTIVGIFYKG